MVRGGEIGYAFRIAPTSFVTPFADVTGGVADLNGFTETGATLTNLTATSHSTDSFRTVLGGQISTEFPIGLSAPVALMARAGWVHEFADPSSTIIAAFTAAPGTTFTVAGAPPLRNAAQVDVGAQLPRTQNAAVFVRYDGEFGDNGEANAITGGLRLTW